MKFENIIYLLKEETGDLEPIEGTHRYSSSTFCYGSFWAEDEDILCQMARFFIESRPLSAEDETKEEEQESQLTIFTHPIEFAVYDNCIGDYCLSPKMIISKISNNKFLIDIYIAQSYILEEDKHQTYYGAKYSDEPIFTKEIEITDLELEEIKNGLYYSLSKAIEEKTNEDIALDMQNYIEKSTNIYRSVDKFYARDKLIIRYGQKYHAKLTWIMYNCIKEESECVEEY